MRCPFCLNQRSRVVDKRDSNNVEETRRRRECLDCRKRFTTYEKIRPLSLIVIKKDGKREEFDRDKLKNGIMKACINRPVKEPRINKMIDEVEVELRKKSEVNSKIIGNLVIDKLKKVDKVAYLRFASIYKSFKDVKSFEKEIKMIK